MSNRSRRSVAQPVSYKDFAETGHRQSIPENGIVDKMALMEENNSDESRDHTTGESPQSKNKTNVREYNSNSSHEDISMVNTSGEASENNEHDEHAQQVEHEHVDHDHQYAHKTNRKSNKKAESNKPLAQKATRNRNSWTSDESNDTEIYFNHDNASYVGHNTEGDEAFMLTVDLDDDDLDADNRLPVNRTPRRLKGKTVTPNRGSKQNKQCAKNASIASCMPKTPKKRITVANRLLSPGLHTPTVPCRAPPFFDDDYFLAEKEKSEREVEAARQMLIHSQREAQIVQNRIQTEAVRRKTAQIQQQVGKHMDRTTAEENRYNTSPQLKGKSARKLSEKRDNIRDLKHISMYEGFNKQDPVNTIGTVREKPRL